MPIKKPEGNVADELRPEYDLASLKGGVRGKYYARATAGTTMVLLEPDVAEAFSDGASVNRALRSYLRTSRGKLPNNYQASPGQVRRSSPSSRRQNTKPRRSRRDR
jgi:hypothetical protein